MKQSREQFEAWVGRLNAAGKAELNSLKRTVNGNYYVDLNTEMLWQAWQASRQSLVVKLPRLTGDAAYDAQEVIDALDAAGAPYE